MNTFLLEEVNQTGDASSRRLFISTRAKLFCACCNDDDDDDEAIEENTASDIDRDAHAGGGILWTAEEDAVLISANKRLGSKWTEVALLLPGRTKRIAIEMLRSHHFKQQNDRAVSPEYAFPKSTRKTPSWSEMNP